MSDRLPECSRRKYWQKLCPPLYQETDPARLPAQAAGYLPKILNHPWNPRGIILNGPTRTGKSRLMWLLMGRMVLDEGIKLLAYDGPGWAMSVAKNMCDVSVSELWLDRVCKVDVLFIDDLFKGNLSDTQERALYAIWERRPAGKLPTYLTMNATGTMIRARMSDNAKADLFDPIMARMGEFSVIYKFDQPKEKAAI